MRLNRLYDIEQYVLQNKMVSIQHLCDKYNVSLSTIRRDINELVKKGIIKKVHGGIAISSYNEVIPTTTRNEINTNKKEYIGELASSLIEDDDSIFLDSGTTTSHILPYIKDKKNITVITHSLDVIFNTKNYSNLRLIVLGGHYNEKTNSLNDATNIDYLNNIKITKAFIGSPCVSIEGGITNRYFLEADIKRAIIQKAFATYLLVDDTKFDKTAVINICQLNEIKAIVTNQKPDSRYVEFAQNNHINIIY